LVSLHYRLQLVLVPQLLENHARHLKVIIGLIHQRFQMGFRVRAKMP
jgi:hypothetical protein